MSLIQHLHCPIWNKYLKSEFSKSYIEQLTLFIQNESKNTPVYPPLNEIFTFLNLCPLDNVKAVIIGQDPYVYPNQAHGLCFSVKESNPIPPSLINIFKELENDLNIPAADIPNGNLSKWAREGVLMLNSILSVSHGKPLSHANKGWEIFTDKIISVVDLHRTNSVFLLWGKHAQQKRHILKNDHLVLTSAHPSPLAAHRGFFHNHHFSQTNTHLKKHLQSPVDWDLRENSLTRKRKI